MTSTNHVNSASGTSLQFSSLLGCTLESIIHQMIYSRSIYPPDSFAHQRHLGVRFHCSRVPQVCDYISNFLKIAVPSIISGVGDSISLVILEEEVASSGDQSAAARGLQRLGTTKTLEKFVFRFQVDSVIYGEDTKPNHLTMNNDGGTSIDIQYEALKRDTELALAAKAQAERSMRDCLLQVLSLRGRRRTKDENADNLSFKLCLHVAEAGEDKLEYPDGGDKEVVGDKGKQCPELMNALNQGEWFQPEESSCLFSNAENETSSSAGTKDFTPIRRVKLPSCGMEMQIGFEALLE